MPPPSDETSRPPRRRALGRGPGAARGPLAGPEVAAARPEVADVAHGAAEAPAADAARRERDPIVSDALVAAATPLGVAAARADEPAGRPEAPATAEARPEPVAEPERESAGGSQGGPHAGPQAGSESEAVPVAEPGHSAVPKSRSGCAAKSAGASEAVPEPVAEPERESAGGSQGGPLSGPPGGLAAESGPVAGPSARAGAAPVAPSGAGSDADGRFTVRLANFEGPFDLLLQLIAKHKMDVTEVALSKVTDEFMAHIRAMGPDWDLDQTTEFLVVAATLLDLKAARLLPAAEVEDEADLALLEARDLLFARLLQYRAYKQVAEILAERWEAEGRRHPRTVGLEPHHAELLPEVVISIGAEGFAKLAVKAMQPKAKPQVYVDHIHAPLVSVREQAGVVVALLREHGTLGFRELVAGVDDTLTVVARFLALLELYREKAVALDQETALGDLTVSWTGGNGTDAASAVTDEFDQEDPEDPEDQEAAS
ncbi:segregation/condensation protein A [Streptomyces sp. NPDC101160]|uniref:segregation/condensation protein A n=1 Tax=Streptomyces sp. NPDC101160 TaxID=3366118 RepID=UPI0038145180